MTCNGIVVSHNEALTECTITIKKVMECFIDVEEITERKEPINIHEEFTPIFISILNEQTNEIYSTIIQSVLKYNNQICVSIFPTIDEMFLYDIPLTELIQLLLEHMIKYQNDNYSEEIEVQTLKLLLSILINEEQHYYKHEGFEYIEYMKFMLSNTFNPFHNTSNTTFNIMKYWSNYCIK
ncbi:hypothetical protein KM1_027070 [Entamoeba histolytica HM-3:IMSS]|uniref:Uncharacterized protein n=1 Tax=Entamoeba histolytica HM-3:IMSS TaxID=885315 RepID=M7VZ64_ENTHI|nr:hypothetical protein KM1_027070 [Entamoeba histolytica HM-3:IMSS]